MTITKHYCDICEREVEKVYPVYFPEVKTSNMDFDACTSELCQDCILNLDKLYDLYKKSFKDSRIKMSIDHFLTDVNLKLS